MSNQNNVSDFKWPGKGWPGTIVRGLSVAAIATWGLGIEAIANATPVLAQGRPELTVENLWGPGGTVRVISGGRERAARVGDTLREGDELIAEEGINVRLVLDNNRGSVEVAELTHFKATDLTSPQINLEVFQGRVRFSLGRLSSANAAAVNAPPSSASAKTLLEDQNDPLIPDPGSKTILGDQNYTLIPDPESLQSQSSRRDYNFRVRTPTGVAGVRGTSFGVNVGQNGQSAIATVGGSVAALANETEVLVGRGEHAVMSHNSAPVRGDRTPILAELKALVIEKTGSPTIRLHGEVNRVDIVYINGQLIETDPQGKFSLDMPRPVSRRLRIVLRGPAVSERVYVLPVD